MNRAATVFFALLAAALLGFIIFLQPALRATRDTPAVGGYVLRFDAEEVRAVSIEHPDGDLLFQKVPHGWEMDTVPPDRVASGRVEALLTAAQNLRVRDVLTAAEVRHGGKELDLGFDPPRLVLRMETGRRPLVLQFGREGAGEGLVYARTDRSEETFLVGEELLQLADRPVDDWRDPRLVHLPVDRVERIRLRRPTGEVELVRQGTRWRLVRPLQGRADSASIDAALELILGARVFAFFPPSNGGSEEGPELLLWEEGEDHPLSLRVVREEDAERWQVRQDRREIVAEVAAENFALLTWKLDQFRSPKIVEINPDLIDRLAVRSGTKTVELRRDGENWTDATGERPVSNERMKILLQLLEAEQSGPRPLLTIRPDGWEEDPTLEIHLNSWLSENTPEALAGLHPLDVIRVWKAPGEAEEAGFWLKSETEPGFLQVSPEWVESVRAWLDGLGGDGATQ
jgi:hypothetical protein